MTGRRRIAKSITALALAVITALLTVMSPSGISAKEEEAASLSVPSAGMSPVLYEFCSFSEESAVEYLATTVVASFESVNEYVSTSGEILGKYIVCAAEEYADVYIMADEASPVVARIYTGGVATLLDLDWEWCEIVSGDVTGYVKTADFVFGELAEERDSETYADMALIIDDGCYLNEDTATSSTVLCVLNSGFEYEVVEKDSGNGFAKLYVEGVGEGYMLTQFLEFYTERICAVTVDYEEDKAAEIEAGIALAEEVAQIRAERLAAEEEAARIAAEEEAARIAAEEAAAAEAAAQAEAEAAAAKAAQEAAAAAAQAAASSSSVSTSSTESSEASSTRSALVEYALSFVGILPYKYGGSSLSSGVDCSGFTQSIYAAFGYSIPRTSSAQASAGRSVSYSEMQPGDLVCYSGHVAIYIGNGLIVHAPQAGEYVSTKSVNYQTIKSIRRIIE